MPPSGTAETTCALSKGTYGLRAQDAVRERGEQHVQEPGEGSSDDGSDEPPEEAHRNAEQQPYLDGEDEAPDPVLFLNREMTPDTDTPYDSDSPRNVAQRRAQHEIAHAILPSIYESETEDEGTTRKREAAMGLLHTPPGDDSHRIVFHGTDPVGKEAARLPPTIAGDHEWLHAMHPLHQEIFWAQCLDDGCTTHLAAKLGSFFYPRRREDAPCRSVYTAQELDRWIIREHAGPEDALFGPDPNFPMRCLRDKHMDWRECFVDRCQVHYVAKARTLRESNSKKRKERSPSWPERRPRREWWPRAPSTTGHAPVVGDLGPPTETLNHRHDKKQVACRRKASTAMVVR